MRKYYNDHKIWYFYLKNIQIIVYYKGVYVYMPFFHVHKCANIHIQQE